MRKAALILYKISFILGIISAVLLAVIAAGAFVCAFAINPELIVNAMTEAGAPEQYIELVKSGYMVMMISAAIGVLIALVFDVIAIVFTNKAYKAVNNNVYDKKVHILAIVFAVLGGVGLTIVGGVFGLINNSRLNSNVVENKAE